ncbi:MAG: alkaline phosphatase family protein [Solirubrobacterales bacterium]|nr:alkaline phosphatase family protein [Solirubrobacterales bacterium]
MAELVLGPLLRHVGDDCAVVWVETDGPCEVSVLGSAAPTFAVCGHHYAIVRVEGLAPSRRYEYDVALDGRAVWPLPDSPFPPSTFHTTPKAGALRISFGSCRVGVPHHEPYTLRRDEHPEGRELDPLRALALDMAGREPDGWPDLLLLLGDQVYADEVSPRTREFIEARRDTTGEPGPIALDYEEYTRLYRESWGDPAIRWLLSTVSTAMVFDDHDVHDDWNISAAWLAQMRATEWWEQHIYAAVMSYWVYQHAGNLSPDEQDRDGLLARCVAAGDAEPLLRELAHESAYGTDGAHWTYHRDLGATRLLVLDSRASRRLPPEAAGGADAAGVQEPSGGAATRSMFDEREWEWVADHLDGDFDHLLLATSLPWLLSPGMHYAEAWSEAVCGGAWGGLAARACERLRQAADLEHWAAFGESFERLARLQREVGAGERGQAPRTIVTLAGDVHHAFVSEVAFRRGSGVRSSVYQAVCSPLRNPLGGRERWAVRFGASRAAHALGRAVARTAGVGDPSVRWRMLGDGPWFDNQVASLRIDGESNVLALDKAVPGPSDERPRLERAFERELGGPVRPRA